MATVSLFWLALLALPALAPTLAFGADPPKRVLIFSSEDSNGPSIAILNQSIRSTTKQRSPVPIQFFFEAQDNFRIPNDKYETELIRLLQRKYDGLNFDLIYALGLPGLKFLLAHRNEIFSDIPLVFATLDENQLIGLDLGSKTTGVTATVELRPTLDLALATQPATEHVVVVAGNAALDTRLVEQARREFQPYEGRVGFTYLTGMSVEELRQKLALLPPKTIVFYLSVNSTNEPRILSTVEVLALLAKTSSVPIYGASLIQLGNGIVGGRLIDFEAMGNRAADMGLRILAGESLRNIPRETLANSPIFDARELKRWGISEAKLPPGSEVRYKQPTFWELYKWRIVGAVSLIIIEALLIAWLLLTQVRRRRAERQREQFAREAEAERRHLDEVLSNTPGVVWEAEMDDTTGERRLHFVSEYIETILGYSVEEWLTKPGMGTALVVEEDRERAVREMEAVISEGQGRTIEFRWTAKDGEPRWVESNVVPTRDDTGKVTGLRGFTMDITGRKDAEEALRQSEFRFRHMADTAPVLIWLADTEMKCTFFNERVIEFTGRSLDDLMGDGWREGIHPDDQDKVVEVYSGAYDHRQPFVMEFRILHANGEYRWVYDTGSPRFASDGELIGYIGSAVDITNLKSSEEALIIAHEEVKKLKNQLEEENVYLREEIKLAHNFDEIIGQSAALKYVLYKVEQVAPTDSTVLITGETGTGKELVARAIHSTGSRGERPMVRVNCAALSASLIESELFGHEKGSFTGASVRKIGRFELAHNATIFLDEIGELPLELQPKLLRVIQEGELERLGSSKTIKVDVRVIAATNRNLQQEVEKGNFREDLWYRLNVFPITVPPLRQRQEDVDPLVEYFAAKFGRKLGKRITSVAPSALAKLREYHWPGNIRELANVIERAVIDTSGPNLRVTYDFAPVKASGSAKAIQTLEVIEREHIMETLNSTGWRIEGPKGAAKLLGINPSTLRARIAKLGIQKSEQSLAEG